MNSVSEYLDDFLSLFFPVLCSSCGDSLFKSESVICTRCIYNLPYTNFHLEKDNRVARQLWGRIPFTGSAAFLYFSKGSHVQNLLHQLKYNNKPEVGVKLGEMYGNALKNSAEFNSIDIIIPVPLHPKRLKQRGYNQSDYFAMGLSTILGVASNPALLKRVVETDSQTKRSRFSRYENMKDVFSVTDSTAIAGKHVLLVDDVITTGATVEACALKLLETDDTKISIVTIAFTD